MRPHDATVQKNSAGSSNSGLTAPAGQLAFKSRKNKVDKLKIELKFRRALFSLGLYTIFIR